MPKSIYLLAMCQALMMSSTTLFLTASALVSLTLVDDKSLATLPVSLLFLGLMLTSIPASMIMGRWGRRSGFIIGSLFGIAGSTLAVWAILDHNFLLFSAASFLVGMFNGFGHYYRFAAVDLANEHNRSTAISYVMAGGVIAAFVGPNIANYGREIIASEPFVGGFSFVIGFYSLVLLIMLFIKLPAVDLESIKAPARPLKDIARQPKFIVAIVCGTLGYVVMSYLMTATPLAMQHHAHAFSETAFVIQWHVLAMFLPSFFTGSIIQRFGIVNIMLIGTLLGLVCIVINLLGQSLWHFWVALVALGISWNFLFISATSLLTETYRPEEKSKTQAMNDFLVFSSVTVASLSAGIFQHKFGWQVVNIGALPLVAIILFSLIWLIRKPENQLG